MCRWMAYSGAPVALEELLFKPKRLLIDLGARGLTFWALLVSSAASPAVTSAAHENHKHVLILHSFGRDFEPYANVTSSFEMELARLVPGPVEFFEASIETARFAETTNDAPLVGYLEALFAEQPMDLLVSIGGPAARFGVRQRERLFPSIPLLAAGVDKRWVTDLSKSADTTAVPVALDLPAAIENILGVLPRTREIVVVLGGSPNSKLWLEETRREFERFFDRVRFTWTNEWSLEEMEKRLGDLPPHSAILFGELSVDAAGIPYRERRALARLHAAANAPIFGLFDTQLGQGIVGGPLLSLSETGKQAAHAASRLLDGASTDTISTAPVTMNVLAYDFRELERWGISETLLPRGSTVSFRPPSVWKQYRWPVLLAFGVVGFQTALIGGLLVHRSRRRAAEEEARALARRLLTAHEDERRRLARELHDDLSQRLARLAIDATRVGGSPSTSSSSGDVSAMAMRDELVRLSEDVHALSYQLHPSILHDLGLKDALKVECDRFSRRESVTADVAAFETPAELPPDVAVCLFRIAQEALRNVARHSGASTVSLTVVSMNGGVKMLVSDNGVGFDPAQRRKRRSLGHASMRERAALVQGTLDVESAPGRGTTVKVSVPLKEGSP